MPKMNSILKSVTESHTFVTIKNTNSYIFNHYQRTITFKDWWNTQLKEKISAQMTIAHFNLIIIMILPYIFSNQLKTFYTNMLLTRWIHVNDTHFFCIDADILEKNNTFVNKKLQGNSDKFSFGQNNLV